MDHSKFTTSKGYDRTGVMHSRAHPLATKQGTVCSGWREGDLHCKHGHVQTTACNPYISPFTGQWTHDTMKPTCQCENLRPNFAPAAQS